MVNKTPEHEHEIAMRKWQMEHELNLERYKADWQWRAQSLIAVTEFAKLGLKTLVLINGAAVLSIMAFLANVAGKESISPYVNALSNAIEDFIYGVALALIATLFSYFAQVVFTELEPPKSLKIGSFLRLVAITGAICSIISFGFGGLSAIDGFKAQSKFENHQLKKTTL